MNNLNVKHSNTYSIHLLLNVSTSGVMVRVLASNAVDCGLEPQIGPNKIL
jgi:hypothetical protein